MEEVKTTLNIDRLAFRLGDRYYPFSLKKNVFDNGRVIYTVEMNIGQNDFIISDGITLEEVFQKHEELMNCAFATRRLQKNALE